MGKSGGTTVIQPSAPPPPSPGQSAAEYAASLPAIYNAALQYQPQFSALDFSDFQKYAPQYAAVVDQTNKELSPYTYGLQEQLAKQASENSQAGVPDSMRQQYLSDLRAELGSNAGSPIGADYVSRNLINQQQQYQQYYQNLGLSLTGRQPLAQPFTQPQSYNVAGGAAQSYASQLGGYGQYLGATRPMLGQSGTPNWLLGMNAVGNMMLGAGSMRRTS